jgi:hypothetical protein
MEVIPQAIDVQGPCIFFVARFFLSESGRSPLEINKKIEKEKAR